MTIKKLTKPACILLLIATILPLIHVVAVDPDCPTDFEVIEVVAATLMENGRITYRCRLCSVIYTEILRATGYAWSDWYTHLEPTCTEAGVRRRSRVLGEPRVDDMPIPALGHVWIETIYEPTCTEYGQVVRTCQTCGEVEVLDEFEPLEHQWIEWSIYLEPQEGIEGLQYRECATCGEWQYRPISALPIVPAPESESSTHWLSGDEVVVIGANISLWFVAGFLLLVELNWLLWMRRKKKELLRIKRREKNGEDGYEFI